MRDTILQQTYEFEGYVTNHPLMFKGVKYDYWKQMMLTLLQKK